MSVLGYAEPKIFGDRVELYSTANDYSWKIFGWNIRLILYSAKLDSAARQQMRILSLQQVQFNPISPFIAFIHSFIHSVCQFYFTLVQIHFQSFPYRRSPPIAPVSLRFATFRAQIWDLCLPLSGVTRSAVADLRILLGLCTAVSPFAPHQRRNQRFHGWVGRLLGRCDVSRPYYGSSAATTVLKGRGIREAYRLSGAPAPLVSSGPMHFSPRDEEGLWSVLVGSKF